ncbi:MAG: aconitate hydratase AcnA, partial [Deltaproteobacteria bacterium]
MNNQEFTRTITVEDKACTIYDISRLEKKGLAQINRLPFSIRILVENLLRRLDNDIVREQDLLQVARWQKTYDSPVEIPFFPARILMQDFTGVPAIVDLAALRDAMQQMGGDPGLINPMVPVDLIIDHSVQVDFHGTADCLQLNTAREYERNAERYTLLKWARQNFDNLRVVPPGSGICHQVNLEYLGQSIMTDKTDNGLLAYPDTLVGTDSHTTMINGIGVMGWGVGGIEAEAVMLGQPYYMTIPEVIGVRMTGLLHSGVTATDLALYITWRLRNYGVVEKFVEFFGPGIKSLAVPDRATIANMSPEYGATMGFFPIDEKTVAYLTATGRQAKAKTVEACAKALNLFYSGENDPEYSDIIEIDLNAVEPAIAGPSRPQDRIVLKNLKTELTAMGKAEKRHSEENPPANSENGDLYTVDVNGSPCKIGNNSVVMAAITSCTNTSNPFVLMGAGLLARNAVKRGLAKPPFVKTVLAPGSRAVTRYLDRAGLMPYFEALGFHTAGFGCMTCIGNSGPLYPDVERAIAAHDLNVAAVLSGNRNFEARIHQSIRSNFLASPLLVVAFALAGRMNVDFSGDALGIDPNGRAVYLADIMPGDDEILELVETCVKPDDFAAEYGHVFEGDDSWRKLEVKEGTTFAWDEDSSYIRLPPYFDGFSTDLKKPANIDNARPLLVLGDTVTTDHISPAGVIPADYPAGRYLTGKGVSAADFNSYGSRRGNHEVMIRGTFGNIRISNQMVKPKTGGYTAKLPQNTEMFIFDAAAAYMREKVPLIVLGGLEYGTGSSRDWAAKGTRLLGIRAVIAESFERIHRSNLVGMGVLPLVFSPGETCASLGLDGSEIFTINGLEDIRPRKQL